MTPLEKAQQYINDTERTPEVVRRVMTQALDSGYRAHPVYASTSQIVLLQKCIHNYQGDKLYFIDLDLWDLAKEFPRCHDHPPGLSISSHFQVNGRPVALKPHQAENDNLDDIEAFFEKFYKDFNCTPYETRGW